MQGGKLNRVTKDDIVHLVNLGGRELLWYKVSGLVLPSAGGGCCAGAGAGAGAATADCCCTAPCLPTSRDW